jgi:RNase H-fold protein (predicted Holliday junction resolvase)
MRSPGAVVGIDPGMRKAGYAVVTAPGSVLVRGIVELAGLYELISGLLQLHAVAVLAIGSGTNARKIATDLSSLGVPIRLVDERETTLQARRLYYAENPPGGWQRFLPLGLRFPPRPIDDYAAELIARRFLALKGAEPHLS